MLHLAQQLASRLRERNILAPTWPNGVRMCWHVCATDAWE